MGKLISIQDATSLVMKALLANGVSEANAKSVADALVAAEVDGQTGHGFARVLAYCAQAKSGKVVGAAQPKAEIVSPALVRVDAQNGFAFPAIDIAIQQLEILTKKNGISAAAIANSHHCGQLGLHVEKLAEKGLVVLMVANAPKAMAPWGGNKPLFGTNPIAFAAPRLNEAPLVIDLSLSKVARGKVMAAKKRGDPIPEGWALDEDGNATTDPDAALTGMMLPTGDAKGAALALIVEILAATITGSNYSYEATSFFDGEGDPPAVGQFMIALNPNGGLGALFADRLKELIGEIEAQEGVRLPGSRRFDARLKCANYGVFIAAHLLREIEQASE